MYVGENGSKSDSMKKGEKNKIIQIRGVYFDIKPTLNVSVFITFTKTLKS